MHKAIRLLMVTVLTVTLGATLAPPAQAHFEHGVNCRITNVRNDGTVTFRITNRLHVRARIECLLRFQGGGTGYYRITVAPRWYVNRRWHYGGDWSWVRITHVHIIRTY